MCKFHFNNLCAKSQKKLRAKNWGITYIDWVSNEDLQKLLCFPPHHQGSDQKPATLLAWPYPVMLANQLPQITLEGQVHVTRPWGQPCKRWTNNFPVHNLPQLICLVLYRSNYHHHIHHLLRRELGHVIHGHEGQSSNHVIHANWLLIRVQSHVVWIDTLFCCGHNPLSWKILSPLFQSLANPKSSFQNPCSDTIFYHCA